MFYAKKWAFFVIMPACLFVLLTSLSAQIQVNEDIILSNAELVMAEMEGLESLGIAEQLEHLYFFSDRPKFAKYQESYVEGWWDYLTQLTPENELQRMLFKMADLNFAQVVLEEDEFENEYLTSNEKSGVTSGNLLVNCSYLASYLVEKGDYDAAIDYYTKATKLLDEESYSDPVLYFAYYYLGSFSSSISKYDQAAKYYSLAINKAKSLGAAVLQIKANGSLIFFTEYSDYKKEIYLEQVELLKNKKLFQAYLKSCYAAWGYEVWTNKGDSTRANELFDIGFSLPVESFSYSWIYSKYLATASDDFDQLNLWRNNTIKLINRDRKVKNVFQFNFSLANKLIERGEYDVAKIMMDEALDIEGEVILNRSLRLQYTALYKYAAFKGDYEQAYENLLKFQSVDLDISQARHANEMTVADIRHKLELVDKENELLELKLSRHSILLGLFVSLLFLTGMVLYSVYRSMLKSRTIARTQSALAEKRKELLEMAEAHREEIVSKNKQLTASKNEIELELKNKLLAISASNSAMAAMRNIVKNSTADARLKKEVIQFIREYNSTEVVVQADIKHLEVNKDFTAELLSLHPDLTSYNVKYCLLIKLGLTTKEIAQLLFKPIATVNMAKSRLRKKLKCPDDITLYSYFNTEVSGIADSKAI